jgi:lipoate-protein ligase A
VTYTIACPGVLGSLGESYLEIHRMLLDALRSLGVPAELAPRGSVAGVDAGACFARPAGGEIMVAGYKVVGSAQLRQEGALLQHGSILLGDDQATVTSVTRGPAPSDLAAPLRTIVGSDLEEQALIGAVSRAAERRWRGVWRKHESSEDIVIESGRHAPRFRSPEWTWGV